MKRVAREILRTPNNLGLLSTRPINALPRPFRAAPPSRAVAINVENQFTYLDHLLDKPSLFVENIYFWRRHFAVNQQGHPHLSHCLTVPQTVGRNKKHVKAQVVREKHVCDSDKPGEEREKGHVAIVEDSVAPVSGIYARAVMAAQRLSQRLLSTQTSLTHLHCR